MRETGKKAERWIVIFLAAVIFTAVFGCPVSVSAGDPLRVEFFYQEVCASCDGTEEFFDIYRDTFSSEERSRMNVDIASYNVFLDSNREYYQKRAKEQGIPQNTALPVLIVEDRWVSGYDAIEDSLKELLLNDGRETGGGQQEENTEAAKSEDGQVSAQAKETAASVGDKSQTVLLLFTTNACEDCEKVKEWLKQQPWLEGHTVLEKNIIDDNCLEFLKEMFRICDTEESRQEVPALFAGDMVLTGTQEITGLTEDTLNTLKNEDLQNALEAAADSGGTADTENEWKTSNLLTLAGAGLLAGFNPCSVSMLLMLLSLLLGAKASVWKNGLVYLAGKYIAYFSLGMVIFLTASQISQGTLNQVSRIVDMILAVLFAAAAVLYTTDAVKIFRQDYGHIRTQLPVGLRKANHRLIKRISGMSGVMQPLLILGLGAAIALGEFFCTGQIYMATITYMLKDGEASVWLPFAIYVTAMSLPALVMILLIQRTRNTERISEFMFRHLGAIKICNAVLFLGFAVYFLVV